jgi:hypothetical protein
MLNAAFVLYVELHSHSSRFHARLPLCYLQCAIAPGDVFLPGIAELHDLWKVDEDALRASDPAELALAVRALSDKGPPQRY